MRASVVRSGTFALEDLPMPEPGPGQVLVKTLACGICGSDLHLFQHGADMMQAARDLGAEPENLTDGLVLGHEFVGEVISYGPDTPETAAVGSRVCSVPFVTIDEAIAPIGATPRTTGAYAEYLLLDAANLLPVSDQVPVEAAALTEPLAIGVHAINKADMAEGATAIIIGCGPIGLSTIALLKRQGVETVIASDFNADRRALAEALGALTVDPTAGESPFVKGMELAPLAPTTIFECVGKAGLVNQLTLEAPLNATIVIAGVCPSEDHYVPMVAMSKELVFRFVYYYAPEEFSEALDILAKDEINWQPLVTGKVGLDHVGDAFDVLMKGEGGHAKILIEPWEDGPIR